MQLLGLAVAVAALGVVPVARAVEDQTARAAAAAAVHRAMYAEAVRGRPPFEIAPPLEPSALVSGLEGTPIVGFDPHFSRLVDAATTDRSELYSNLDGSMTQVVSSGAVRFKDEAGAWRTIDLTLVPGPQGLLRAAAAPGAGRIATSSAGDLAVIPTAAGDVRFHVVGARSGVTGRSTGRSQRFANLLGPGRSVEVAARARGLEDSLILDSPSTSTTSYQVQFIVPPKVVARGGAPVGATDEALAARVEFVDERGDVVATYGGGVAYDSASPPAFAQVVSTLVDQSGAVVTVANSVDASWLQASDRVFPVSVDPTYTAYTGTCPTSPPATGTATYDQCDTWVSSSTPFITPTDLTVLYEGGFAYPDYYTGGNSTTRMYLQFPTDSFGFPGYERTVTSATLSLYNTTGGSSTGLTKVAAAGAPPWSGLTWSNQPSSFYRSDQPVASLSFAAGSAWRTWDVTALASAWFSGGLRNDGIVVWENDERNANQWRAFRSSEYSATYAPKLTVTYNDPPPTTPTPPPSSPSDLGATKSQDHLGDPVNVVTGNMVDTYDDLPSPSGAAGLTWARTYNLFDTTSSAGLGRGWSSSFSPIIQAVTGGYEMTNSDGRHVRWTTSGSTFLRPAEFPADLAMVNGLASVTYNDGTVWDFDSSGRLAKITDWSGQNTTVNRDTNGKLTTATASNGAQLTFTYGTTGTATGKIVSVAGVNGTVTYGYDANGNQVTATDAAGKTTTYGYDASNRLTSITDPAGVIVAANTFDTSGRVATQQHPSGATTTFAYGAYDAANGWWQTVVSDSVTGTAGAVTYSWDSQHRVRRVSDNVGGGNTAARTYSTVLGDLTQTTSRVGGQRNFTYDTANRITCAAEPGAMCPTSALSSGSGTYLAYHFDSQGRVDEQFVAGEGTTTFTYTGANRAPTTTTAPNGDVTTFSIASGLLTQVTDADGVTTTYAYDSSRRLTSETNGAGQTTSYAYDTAGRLRCTAEPGATCPDAAGAGGAGSYTTTTYDAAGRVVDLRAADGGITHDTYNNAGQVLTITDPTGAVTTNTYSATTGLLMSVSRPGRVVNGNLTYGTWRYTYDGNGNQTCEARPGGTCPNASGTGGVQPYTRTTWGPLGRQLSTTNELGQTTSYGYDADGNQTQVTKPDGSITVTAYDVAGRAYCSTEAGMSGASSCPTAAGVGGTGRYTFTTFDTAGRVSCVADPGGSCTTTAPPITTYTYDTNGRQATVTDGHGGVTTTSYTLANRTAAVTGPDGGITTTAYDSAGRPTTVTDPRGGATATAYNAQGRVQSTTNAAGLATQFTYDAAGRQATITDPAGVVTTRSYTTRGELRTEKVGAQGTVTYNYNGDGTVHDVTDPLGTTTTYDYDATGNRTSRTTTAGSTGTVTLVGATAGKVSSGNLVLSLPTGTQAGDLILVASTHRKDTPVNTPAGMTLVGDFDGGTTSSWLPVVSVFKSLATAGQTTVTVTNPSGSGKAAVVEVLHGADATTPIEASAAGAVPNYSTNPLVVPGITTVSANARLVEFMGAVNQPTVADFSPPAGMVERADTASASSTYVTTAVADETWATPGATGSRTATLSVAAQMAGVLLAIKPVPAASTGSVTETWAYDDADQLVDHADELNRHTTHTYTNDTTSGRRETVADPSGRAATTAYNPDGTIKTKSYAGGPTQTYTYDTLGHLASVNTGSGIWGYTYDPTGLLTSVTSPQGRRVAWTYDQAGRRASMTYPDGNRLDYLYDENSRLSQLLVTQPDTVSQTPSGPTVRVEAEDVPANQRSSTLTVGSGCSGSCTGFSGAGYLGNWGTNGQYVNVAFTAPTAGRYRIGFRYAAGNGASSRRIEITGATGTPTVWTNQAFAATTDWSTWNTTYVYTPQLNAGANTIKISLSTADGNSTQFINLDTVDIAPITDAIGFGGATTANTTGQPATGSVSLVGAAAGSVPWGNLVVTLPAGTQAGDLILVAATHRKDAPVNTPAGMTLVGDFDGGTTSSWLPVVSVFKSSATAGQTTVTVTDPSSGRKAAVVEVLRGADATTPIEASASGAVPNYSTNPLVVPGVTTVSANARLIEFMGAVNQSTVADFTPPAGMVERADTVSASSTYVTTAVADETWATPGATGSRTATLSVAAQMAGVILAIKPSVPQGSGATLTLTRPPTTESGDLLLASVTSPSPVAAPSGWVTVASSTATGLQVWRHNAAPSDPVTWTFTPATNTPAAGTITAHRGVNTATPIASTAVGTNSSGTSHTAPSTNAPGQGDWLVNVYAVAANTTITASAGATQRAIIATTGGNARTVAVQDTALTATGATGTRTVTSGTAGTSAAISLALAPQPPSSGGSQAAATYTYTADGRLLTETLPDGNRTYSYGATGTSKGKLTTYNQTLPGANRTTALGYDTTGRLTSEATAGITTNYGYDNASQLTSATPTTGAASSWTYDYLGRRATETTGGIARMYKYDDSGQLCWTFAGLSGNTCNAAPSGSTTYTFDGAGRRLSETVTATDKVTYTYDREGRISTLERVSGASSTTQTRTYDSDDNIAVASNSGAATGTSIFDWDIASDMAQLADINDGVSTNDLIRGDHWAAGVLGSAVMGIGLDAHESVVPTTSTSGLAQSTTYGAWGEPGGAPTVEPTIGYRGELAIDTLLSLRARQYQSTTGQFMSRDPFDGVDGSSTVAFAYAYADNTPLMRVDPRGLQSEDYLFTSAAPACSGPHEHLISTPPRGGPGPGGQGFAPGSECVQDAPTCSDTFSSLGAAVEVVSFGGCLATHSRSPIADTVATFIAGAAMTAGADIHFRCRTSAQYFAVACLTNVSNLPADVFWTLSTGAAAITIGHYIFCKENCKPSLLEHELVHVGQWEWFGDRFATLYLGELIRTGGDTECKNIYEIPAYAKNDPCPH